MRILLSVLTIFVLLPTSSDSTSISGVVSSLWRKFWSSSCEFSSNVSRSRRSIREFPNTQDPDEFFEYLYPSLHLTHEDVASGRSFHFTSWFDDLVEYWETECHSSGVSSRDDKETPDYGLEKGSNFNATTAPSPNVSMVEDKEGQVGENVTITSNTTALQKDTKQAGQAPQSPLSELAAALFPTPPAIAALTGNKKPINKFFAQYGGDFEYFFPVWGFGIPFDGEITFLGFHGFKGLFPYRR